MSISLIQRCSTTSSLKRTTRASRASRSTDLRAAHAFERGEDLRLLHLMASERGGERRQREGPVFPDLDELAAVPNRRTGPSCGSMLLRDNFVAVEFGEGLHG